jgi:sialic acid synthase SpsE
VKEVENKLKSRFDSGEILVIAEIGINHNGDINICKKMMLLAKFAGVDYVKIQML